MRFSLRLWLVPLLVVAGLVALLQGFRLHRVLQLSALAEWSVDAPTVDATSPTGYAHGRRWLLIDDPVGQSQQWIAQTQQALAENRWRIHAVDYDNAPNGRESHLPLLYRGWLATLARAESVCTGIPAGIAVEHAALYADLLLQTCALILTVWFVTREFGPLAAGAVGVGLLTLHPLATNFLPAAPQAQGPGELCALASVLPLAAAALRAPGGKTNRLCLIAGLAGGIGLSLNLLTQLSLVIALAGGALFATLRSRSDQPLPVLAWRWWGLGGALASLALYAADYFPGELNLRLEANHPLYAVGWLALGEALQQLLPGCARPAVRPTRRSLVAGLGALTVLMGVVAFVVRQAPSLLATDLTIAQLTRLQGSFTADHLAQWLTRDGGSLRLWATLTPALLLILGAGVASRRTAWSGHRAVRLLLFPLLVTAGIACFRLRWWNTFDTVGLVVLASALHRRRAAEAPAWIAGAVVPALLGLLALVPPRATFHAGEFQPAEMQAVMERDLAHWIAQRRPDAIVLAPPALTTSLWYYGGVRGITTFDPANREGLMGALHIAAATTPQEAQVLLLQRVITHVVLPPWDQGLDVSARELSGSTKSLFIEQLRDWILPAWMRPVAYYLPPIEGFAERVPVVLEVGDEQPDAALVSAMATYFLEAGLPGHASELRKFVQRFPHDLSALVSLAEIERVREDETAFATAVAALEPVLAAGGDRRITWDRRIALATVLAQAGRPEAARQQATRCYAEADEAGLRSLTPRTLYRFLALGRLFDLRPADPTLAGLAEALLPPDFRAQLH